MSRDEMNKTVAQIADENIELKSKNARLRAELSRTMQAWKTAKENETRLRAMLITSARAFHSVNCEDVPMSICNHPACQAAVKEM